MIYNLSTPLISYPPAAADKVHETTAEVNSEISRLRSSFKVYKSRVKECLKRRRVPVKKIIDVLTSADVDECQRTFLLSHLSDLFKAADHDQLFVTMNFGWDYLDPSLLDHLVVEFELEDVKIEMVEYKSSLQQFRIKAPLTLFCDTRKRKKIEIQDSTRDSVNGFDWEENISLDSVERFRQQCTPHLSLGECAVIVADICGLLGELLFLHVSAN